MRRPKPQRAYGSNLGVRAHAAWVRTGGRWDSGGHRRLRGLPTLVEGVQNTGASFRAVRLRVSEDRQKPASAAEVEGVFGIYLFNKGPDAANAATGYIAKGLFFLFVYSLCYWFCVTGLVASKGFLSTIICLVRSLKKALLLSGHIRTICKL